MTDRNLLEPNQALAQRLAALTSGLRTSRRGQRWPGKVRQSTQAGFVPTTTSGVGSILDVISADAGAWLVFGRAIFQVFNSAGTPDFTGDERARLRLVTFSGTSLTEIDQLDDVTASPACTPDSTSTNNALRLAINLFGFGSYDDPVSFGLAAGAAGDGATHNVSWFGAKLMAVPI